MKNEGIITWRQCEIIKEFKYISKGCKILPTGRGSDFLALCPQVDPTLIEVKNGCGSLSKLQKKMKGIAQNNGFNYIVERCHCAK